MYYAGTEREQQLLSPSLPHWRRDGRPKQYCVNRLHSFPPQKRRYDMARDRLLDRLQYYLIPAVVVLLVVTIVVAQLVDPANTVIIPGSAIGARFIVLRFWYLLSDHEQRRFLGDTRSDSAKLSIN